MEMGGAIEALENGYMKRNLVQSNAKRLREIETQKRIVVGVNKFTEGESSPLTENIVQSFLSVDDAVEAEQISSLERFRKSRDKNKVAFALDHLGESVIAGENIMDASIKCAEAGVTTGEWADTLRDVLGEYRAPTGISGVLMGKLDNEDIARLRAKIQQLNEKLGRNLKLLIGKPGLDGHSNGAEQIAVKAREAGMEVVYEGIRLTPEKIAESALQEGVHVVGLSILSGSHLSLVPEVIRCMKQRGLEGIPLVLGGIIPKQDIPKMDLSIIRRVYAPRDFDLNRIMNEIIDVVARANDIKLSETEGNIRDG